MNVGLRLPEMPDSVSQFYVSGTPAELEDKLPEITRVNDADFRKTSKDENGWLYVRIDQ